MEAVGQYRAALHIDAASLPCLINFAWLLSAHRDPSLRRPPEAIQLAERAVALTNRTNAEALDVLAAAYGAEARWDAAVATALEALRAADSLDMDLANEIRKRLDLYLRRIPFIVPEG